MLLWFLFPKLSDSDAASVQRKDCATICTDFGNKTMPLCKSCVNFEIKNFLARSGGHCFIAVKDVLVGHQNNCDFCSILVKTLLEGSPDCKAKWVQMELYNGHKRLSNKDISKLTRNLGITALVATLKEGPWGDNSDNSRHDSWRTVQLAVAADKCNTSNFDLLVS